MFSHLNPASADLPSTGPDAPAPAAALPLLPAAPPLADR